MDAKYKLILLEPAQRITNRIYPTLEKLQLYPELGIACHDKQLALQGYRLLICGQYPCFYRIIEKTALVYHIVDGRSNYPKLLDYLKGVDT